MDLKYFLQQLKEKYKYNAELLDTLEGIIPLLIEYYGIENRDTILESIYSCKIIKCNSEQIIKDLIKENNMTKEIKEKTIREEYIDTANGIYYSSPQIIYNWGDRKFDISETKRIIGISNLLNFKSPAGIAELSFHLCSLVKSYKNEYIIKEDNLYKRQGLKGAEYKINLIENNNCLLTLIKEENYGLEEGLNIYDGERIASKYLKDEYTSYSNIKLKEIATILNDRLNLTDELKHSQITGEKEIIKTAYNINSSNNLFEELCNLADESLNLEYKRSVYIVDKDIVAEATQELEGPITGQLFNNIAAHINYRLDQEQTGRKNI